MIQKQDGQSDGQTYWRSLAELGESPAVRERLEQEFTGYDPDALLKDGDVSRRGFLKLMGASMALAGLATGGAGCRRWPEQEVRPYARRPEGSTPGVAQYFASMMEIGGVAEPMLVRSFDGRPIKVEGNPDHPFSKGVTSSWAQASTLGMYDPQRSRVVVEKGRAASEWSAFERFAGPYFEALRANGGKKLAVLSERTSSPTMTRLRQAFAKAYPAAAKQWFVYEPVNSDNETAGMKLAFGQTVRPRLKLDQAKIIAFFDGDFLSFSGGNPAAGRYAKDWAASRRNVDHGESSRTYAIEARFTNTGAAADIRIPAKPSRVGVILEAVASRLGVAGAREHGLEAMEADRVALLVSDLKSNPGAGVVAVGESQPAQVHALAAKLNTAIGAVGKTVEYLPAGDDEGRSHVAAISELSKLLADGDVDTLVILGGNPGFDAPADLGFADLLSKATVSIHLSDYVNETSAACSWHLPRAHHFECWGDGLAYDGTVTIQQPLILPMWGGRSAIELVAQLVDGKTHAGYDLVRRTLAMTEPGWRQAIHDGFVAGTAAKPASVTVSSDAIKLLDSAGGSNELELVFITGGGTYDGRYANNGWLIEAPDSMTKLTWDRGVLLSKADADALGVSNDDLLSVTTTNGKAAVELAVYIMPGLAKGTAVVELGYGRTMAGSVGNGVGVDVYPLRTTAAMALASAKAKKTGRTFRLASTQDHFLIDEVGQWGRDKRFGKIDGSGYVVKDGTLEAYKKDSHLFHRGHHGDLSLQLYDPPFETPAKHPDGPTAFNDPHAWGMSIDMNTCIGCNACVVACQAENNIPVVGREAVITNREMHWLRIDRYFKGSVEDPDAVAMPVMCVHCENAPCEQVCPVAATVHDTEGLNTMVYNRCVGTRYCSNNCPYKVRRFNYFDWHAKGATSNTEARNPNDDAQPWMGIPDTQQNAVINQITQMVFNPDVTVRMRGVMEKCTYCVQRIQDSKITAKNEFAQGKNGRSDELVRDGEVTTACESSCPTDAIVFGNLNDPNSRVWKNHSNPRSYKLLEELNSRPRTKHMARLRNRPEGMKKTPAGFAHIPVFGGDKDKKDKHEGDKH